jgi:hypothetical protein
LPHSLRISLEKGYEMTIEILETMAKISHFIGIEPDDLPNSLALNKSFRKIKMYVWRVLLGHSIRLHNLSPHATVDATYYERALASKHCCDRTNYHVQTIEIKEPIGREG